MEVWKDIPGYKGDYQASDLGRIKSFKRAKEKILSLTLNSNGYFIVTLCNKFKSKNYNVHSLIANTFLNCEIYKGERNGVIDHISGIKTDNKVKNLQIISQRKNTSKDQSERTSNYIGVSRTSNNKWLAQIRINGKVKYLGRFFNEQDASNAYQLELTNLLK